MKLSREEPAFTSESPSALEPVPTRAFWQLEERTSVSAIVALLVFASFLTYYGLLCVRPDWGGDFQLYCAGVARLYRDLRNPLHEALNLPSSQSTMYTPFLVGVAVIGRLLGATPFGALQIAGVLNLVLLVGGACFFFSRASMHRQWWLPAACFVFATLLLRWHHVGWASEISLTNLQYIQPYPGTFAWGLALIALGLLEDLRKNARALTVACLSIIMSLLLSCHVLTGSWVVGVAGLYAVYTSVQQRSARPLAWAAAAVCAAFAPVLLWPYAPFLDQIGDSTLVRSMQRINTGLTWGESPLLAFPTLYGLALPCFVYMCGRLRRHGVWLLSLSATLGALWVWHRLGLTYGSRYALFAVLFAQFVVAEVMALGVFALLGPLSELPPTRRWPRLDRPLVIVVLLLAATAWLPSPMRATARQTKDYGKVESLGRVLRRPSGHDAYYRQFSDVVPYLSPHDVVLMPVSRGVLDFASITGASVVSTALAMRVTDGDARFRAVARFFDAKTSAAARRSIAAEYGATKILVPRRQFFLIPALTQTFGEPIHRGEDHVLLAI